MVDYTQYATNYPQVYKKLFKFLKETSELRSEELKESWQYYAPAKYFEQKTNITSVSGNWKMPEEYSEASLSKAIMDRTFLRYRIQGKLNGYTITGINEVGTVDAKIFKNKFLREFTKPHGQIRGALEDLLQKLEKNDLAFYNDILDRLRDANLELRDRNIDRTNIKMVFNEIDGIISQFTLQDIDFYHALYSKSSTDQREISHEYKEMRELIRSNLGEMYWVPSPQTMEAIIKQMDAMSPPSSEQQHGRSSHITIEEVPPSDPGMQRALEQFNREKGTLTGNHFPDVSDKGEGVEPPHR